MKVHNLKELNVWKKAVGLAVLSHILLGFFPVEEKYERSALSIPSNIAEGCGRVSNIELKHFVSILMGSRYELETQMILVT